MHRTGKNLLVLLALGLVATLMPACGEKAATDDGATSKAVGTGKPGNSTGTETKVALKFATIAGPALALQGATSLDAGGGITLTEARINLGSIKIKAEKEETEDELELEAQEEAEEKADDEESAADDELEQRIDALEEEYDQKMEAAATEAEEDALEAEFEAKEAELEVELAAIEKAQEEEEDRKEAERDESMKWQGPFVYDVVAQSLSTDLPPVKLLDGSYERIEFKLRPSREAPGTDPLLNQSIYLKGTAMVGQAAVAFSLAFPFTEEFKLKGGAGGIQMDANVQNNMALAFNVSGWFAGLDFSAAVKDPAGAIVIDDKTNVEILNAFRKNVKRSTKFGEDEDGDGELEGDETKGDGEEDLAEEESETGASTTPDASGDSSGDDSDDE